MFEGILPKNLNIYATTASRASESSYGYYCGANSVVNGTHLDTCLGDEYSIRWMEYIDSIKELSKVPLEDQYEMLRKATVMSQVQQYGDFTMKEEPLSNFFAKCSVLDYFLGLFAEKETIY